MYFVKTTEILESFVTAAQSYLSWKIEPPNLFQQSSPHQLIEIQPFSFFRPKTWEAFLIFLFHLHSQQNGKVLSLY